MTVEFEPTSWLKGASAIAEEAAAFHAAASATLASSSDVGSSGSVGGATLVDQAIATVLPPVFEQVGATISALADGLGQEAELMRATAAAYTDTEAENAQAASQVGEG